MQSVVFFYIFVLCAIMLSLNMLNAIMQSVIMLIALVPYLMGKNQQLFSYFYSPLPAVSQSFVHLTAML